MKILYIVRDSLFSTFGGDTVQIYKTKEYLERKYSVKIDIVLNNKDLKEYLESNDYDIYHFWGIDNFLFNQDSIQYLKSKNKTVVTSTISWDMRDSLMLKYFVSPFLNYNIYPQLENFCNFYTKYIAKPCAYIIPQYRKKLHNIYTSKVYKLLRDNLVKYFDAFIPNSDEEGKLYFDFIDTDYEKVANKIFSVPNAVDIDFIKNHKDTGFMSDIKDFVIEAAGIEPLKNQLGLLKALYKSPEIPIIFAGQVRDEKYYNKLKNFADKRGNIYFTGKISPEDLFSLYKRAKVHVLASFRESPGLATLESLMCGSQIVVSNEKFCPIKYYKFDKYGFVCNPYDIKSIKNAILEAYNNPKDINLPEDYIKFFSYENVADMTYEVYEKLSEQ